MASHRHKFATRVAVMFVFATTWHSRTHGQLVSEIKSADQSMLEFLLIADELSSQYCFRLEGESTSIRKKRGEKYFYELNCIGAASDAQNSRYFCFGMRHPEYPQPHLIRWQEVLEVKELHLYKSVVGDRPEIPRDRIEKKNKDGKETLRKFLFPTNMDGFGLVLAQLGEVTANGAVFQRLRQNFLTAELQNSRIDRDESGNIVGTWVFPPQKTCVCEVEFGAKCGFQPIRTQWRAFDPSRNLPGRIYSSSRIDWKRHWDKAWMPVNIQIHGTEVDATDDFSFRLEWLHPEFLGKDSINFAEMTRPMPANWRDVFLKKFEVRN